VIQFAYQERYAAWRARVLAVLRSISAYAPRSRPENEAFPERHLGVAVAAARGGLFTVS
jgi:hypothetical protein